MKAYVYVRTSYMLLFSYTQVAAIGQPRLVVTHTKDLPCRSVVAHLSSSSSCLHVNGPEPSSIRRLAPRPAPVRPSQPEKGQNTTRTEPPMGRILYVISSFDRGQRLGKQFTNKLDKLDFVLLMLDEMREACEVSAWERRCLVSGRGRRHGRARTCSNLTDFLGRQTPCTVGGCQSRVLSGHIRGRRRSAAS